MFTGIIEAIGTVDQMESHGGDMRLTIATGKMDMTDVQLGDSIAVNGVCLTAVDLQISGFAADVSSESLSLTTLGELAVGGRVNLEKALTLATRLGGHMVSGHVDGLGKILERHDDARSVRFAIEAPADLVKYIAKKGSVTVDGVSLTVNAIVDNRFEINIVPHTMRETIMSAYMTGKRVNLEVDLIARYLEQLLSGNAATLSGKAQVITAAKLQKSGFI